MSASSINHCNQYSVTEIHQEIIITQANCRVNEASLARSKPWHPWRRRRRLPRLPSPAISCCRVPSPHVYRMGGCTRHGSLRSVAVGRTAQPDQASPAQGNGGGGGGVHATQRTALMAAARGPTPPGQQPAEGTGGGGGKVHSTPMWALMALGGRVHNFGKKIIFRSKLR